MATSMAMPMLMKLSVNCLPTPAWPTVILLLAQVLLSGVIALATLPVTVPVLAELPTPAVTSPMFCWPCRAIVDRAEARR